MTTLPAVRPAGERAGSAGGPLTGTGVLAKLALRRDRIMLPLWVYVVVIGVASNAFTFARLYKTESSRQSLVASGLDNPALIFLYGRLNGDSVGALTAWRYGVWGALFAALMSVFLVVRHTRADEEAGRLELIGSARVGRQAPLASALAVAVLANALLTVLLCVILPPLGLPAAGSVALALAIGTCGLAFTGVSLVAAQLTAGARAARGLVICVLGVSFLARAVGDATGASGPSWLTWTLPLGWTEMLRPYSGERWWVLALPLALFAACVWLAFWLAARRDHGAGLFPDRPGRPAASAALSGPAPLAWRLQWPALAGWAAGYAVMFAVCGAAAKGIGQLVGTSSALNKEFTRIGGQSAIVNAYLAALMLLAGLVAAAYGVSAVLRSHAEETAGRADPVLAAAVGRVRWGLSHLLVACAGTALLVAVAGVATGLGYGLSAGGAAHQTARMLAAGIAQFPAAMVIIGVAVLALGAAPDACVAIAWSAVGLAVLLDIFGQALQLSHWVLDVSPFTHAPRLPGGAVSSESIILLIVIAISLCVTGLAALRRRDIG
ncbi:ABC transporter permease [Trebonia kvetii]|uniref:ABC transporter permease n=1 Tax=Trebonia kvetii TaxID=2480626 RepID=A0A6P2BKU9_9ACTN|nr:ABC transporter permease [Trebonia kvetii]TVY99626.1 ABC transporter permease [Trebonia kvetii]